MRRFRRMLHLGGEKDSPKDSSKKGSPPDETEPALPNLGAPISSADSRGSLDQTQGFFSLPPELRQAILLTAFGGRTIHIDLRYGLPLHTHETSGGRDAHHGGFPPLVDFAQPAKFPPMKRGEDKAWRWYSCICHRVPPPWKFTRPVWVEPQQDSCLRGTGMCRFWPGPCPEKCHLGAMGFLLSSKQSYNELLSVLFATNTIFLESQPLIQGLLQQGLPDAPRLTGPGFVLATSLEMRLELTLFGSHSGSRQDEQRNRFREYLQRIPLAFPSLKRLYLAFEGELYHDPSLSPYQNRAQLDAVLLQPLLQLRQNLGLDEFTISVPASVFEAIQCMASGRGRPDAAAFQIWYPLGPSDPEPTSHDGAGYWTRRGLDGTLAWHSDGTSYANTARWSGAGP